MVSRMKMKKSTLLILITASLFSFAVARRCESQDGRRSINCDDSRICCEINGRLDCCTASDIWWVWLLLAIFIVMGISCCCCCCYFAHKRGLLSSTRSTPVVVQTVRTVAVPPSNREVKVENTKQWSSCSPDAPPPYSEVAN